MRLALALVLAGCACPDADGDGVCDAEDACDDAEDADGDGVCDALDACPGWDDGIDDDGDGTPDLCEAELLAEIAPGEALGVRCCGPVRVYLRLPAGDGQREDAAALGPTLTFEPTDVGRVEVVGGPDDPPFAAFAAGLTDGEEQDLTLRVARADGDGAATLTRGEALWGLGDPDLVGHRLLYAEVELLRFDEGTPDAEVEARWRLFGI